MPLRGPFRLHTPRLTVRPIGRSDLPWLAELWADPDVTRYLGGSKNRAEVDTWYEERVLGDSKAMEGLGIWLTVESATGQPVGFHLLNFIKGEPLIQVGFALAAPFWNRGYASEMAREVLRYGFADLAIPEINGIANVENTASQRALEKIGLRRIGDCRFPAYDGLLARFVGEREAWLRDHAHARREN